MLPYVFFFVLRKALDVHDENYGPYTTALQETTICSSCGKVLNETYRAEETNTICDACQ
ncbi:hypothetical protein ACFO4L_11075 [Bacillus daqingensis]|uniref:YhfH family protein n=1 Tax=Bacillus daqingensis TaxID=872396 RepID=A0ABV9NYH7_9BACI